MRIFLTLTNILPAIFILAAPIVTAVAETEKERTSALAPDRSSHGAEKEDPKLAQTSEELLKIIEKQEVLIKALRARIKELEQANMALSLAHQTNNK